VQDSPPVRQDAADGERLTPDQVSPGVTCGALTRSDVLALSGEREMWLRRMLAAERAAYERGRADGWRDGFEAAYREIEAAWHAVADPVARGGPSHAELERRRWGPGGREHFGDPRPDDYMGGPVPWQPGWTPGSGTAPEAAA
jgi:hypothetical protein